MENTPYLYDTLVRVLSQHAHWLDFRHQKRREAPAFMPGRTSPLVVTDSVDGLKWG